MDYGEQQHIFYAHRGRSTELSRSPSRSALTLLEMVIALALMTIVFAAIVPQFSAIRKNWDSKAGSAEMLANGRVLMDHMNRNLSKAVKITSVSEFGDTDGYIEFEDNDGNTLRYDIAANYYVEYGVAGSLSDLAGSVSSLTFSCYDACDLDTVISPVTDVNIIRAVTAEVTFTNSAELGQDLTFATTAYLRTNGNDSGQVTWLNQDIGDIGAVGSATRSGCDWTVEGSGYDIMWDTDEFHYVYQSLSGDGEIIARVASIENTGSYAKAGLMIRETLTGDSKYAGIFVTPYNGAFFQYRTSTGGFTSFTGSGSTQAPYWFKLTRSGNIFTGYESSNGSDWTQVDSASVSIASDVYIGLAVGAGNDGVLCTAEFDNINSTAITYETFTEAKVSSDAESITISTPGGSGISIVGSWTTGFTHTAESGSNRALIFIAHEESISGSPTLTSVTYGGQAMTKVIEKSAVAAPYGNYVAAFILNEAGINAATSSTFVPAWSATTSSVSYASVFLSNVNQTTLTGASASNGTTSSTPNPITTSALATNSGDMVIVGATCGNNGSYTVNNGFTEGTDQSVGAMGHTGVTGYKTATGANETPSATHSGPNRQVIIGFVVQSGGVSDIEGDLLVAAVATDGDTSSSLAPPGGEGWTEIDIEDYSGEVTLGAWWKLAEASETASHQFTWTGDEQAYGWMMQFTGHNSSDPIDIFSAGGQSSSTPISSAVTTTVNNCMIVRLGAFDGDDITEDDPGLSGHTAITMDESDSGGGGSTVAILGSWTSGLTHTAETGSNRLLIFVAHAEHNSYVSLNSVTYGGRTMTEAIDYNAGVFNAQAYVAVYILDEADIDAASGNTFSPNWSTTPLEYSYSSVFLSNVNQTTHVGATAQNGTASSTPNPITTSSLSTNTGDMVIVAATAGNSGDYTVNNGFTEGIENDMASSIGVSGTKSATGADETPSVTYSGAYLNRQVIVGLVVQVGSGAETDTVSGGAGYLRQSSGGSSGTSTFSLGSSNEAQMLTIAIAPDSDSSGCGGSIRP